MYSGGAAILSRERPGAFLVPSRPPLVSSWTYRLALPLTTHGLPCGRSRTFIGQCCQPFCPGDPTNHSDGPHTVTKSRCGEGKINPSGLHQAWELGPPSEPNRDTSRTVSTWPLRRRSLPPDAGCIPRLCRVRVESSRRTWIRPGRIRFTQLLSDKIAPFETKPTTPAVHAKPDAQVLKLRTSAVAHQYLCLVRSLPP